MSAATDARSVAPMARAAREAAMARAAPQAATIIAAIAEGAPVDRAAIVRRLWGDVPITGPVTTNFHRIATAARRALAGSGYGMIHLGDGWYQLREGEQARRGPKPAVDAERLRGARVVRVGSRGFQAVDGSGEALSGMRFTHHDVEDVLDRMRAKARVRARPCMTCTDTFQSEGPHNRMCPGCRSRKRGGWLNGEAAR